MPNILYHFLILLFKVCIIFLKFSHQGYCWAHFAGKETETEKVGDLLEASALGGDGGDFKSERPRPGP